MAYTFAGGIRLGGNKKARRAMIEKIPGPETVYLRVGTIGGEPFVPCVAPGDTVLLGEPIAMPARAAASAGRSASSNGTASAENNISAEDGASVKDSVSAGKAGAPQGEAASGSSSDHGSVDGQASPADAAEGQGTPEGEAATDDASDTQSLDLRCGVYASVAGTVVSVKKDEKGATVAIRRGKEQQLDPRIKPYPKPLQKIPQPDIIERIKKYAVTGRDGPTARKLEAARKNNVRRVIVDLTDPEPSLTAAYRLTAENTEAVLGGVKILLMAVGLRRAELAIESNKRKLLRRLREEKSPLIRLVTLQPKFPQADARELVAAVYGTALGTDKDITKEGYVIFRASECADVYGLFACGMPPIERVVSVAGDCVGGTRNLLLPVGTPYEEIAAFIGGFSKNPALITENGGLRGRVVSADGFVGASTSALLFSSAATRFAATEAMPCIRCGRCVNACPARITPYRIARAMEKNRYGAAKKYGAEACLQCGACTYVCPSSIPLSSIVREAKRKTIPEDTPKASK